MNGQIIFDPLLPWGLIAGLAVLVGCGAILCLWRGLSGWALRLLAGLLILGALSQPSYQIENRAPLDDVVLIIVDETASQRLAERAGMTSAAADQLETALQARPGTQVRRVPVTDGPDDAGTQLMTALNTALAEEPQARIAGILLLSDGRLHDLERAPDLPAPLHLLLTGRETDWDRRLIVRDAPAFAILGEPVELNLKIEDDGAGPDQTETQILIAVDGGPEQRFTVPIGEDLKLPITLPHGGMNVIEFTVPTAEGELTDRNNKAIIQINGVRDRLRVLLVSGEPHAGGRTWRNLLKSDSSVDLVHFTILRPPEKQDGVPVNELSLIAFPTRELFLEKIDDFDLIIFDRYKRRGILPSVYLDNVRNYVEKGGAVLVAAGPDFASADSIFRSPLSEILPGEPTAHVIEKGFRPTITELGEKHPVTSGLTDAESWGRWMRQIEVNVTRGDTVMTGADDQPLLVLDRVGAGRVALLASDHAWLWSRGFEGGGPQLELLRRLAHWMMKEPDLEEESLWAEPNGQSMRIIRRSLTDNVDSVTITRPDGETETLPMQETSPGQFEALYDGPQIGLYRLETGEQNAVIGLGPSAPKEFEQTIASAEPLRPLIATGRGGALRLEDGVPQIRDVRPGRVAAGRGWVGITPRDAYATNSVTQTPLLPNWLVLLLVGSAIVGAWLYEGRRSTSAA